MQTFSCLVLSLLTVSFPHSRSLRVEGHFEILCGESLQKDGSCRLEAQTDKLDQTEHFQMLSLGHFRWFWAPKVGILHLENFLEVQNPLKVKNHLRNFMFVSMWFPAEKVFGFFKFSKGSITSNRSVKIKVRGKSSFFL